MVDSGVGDTSGDGHGICAVERDGCRTVWHHCIRGAHTCSGLVEQDAIAARRRGRRATGVCGAGDASVHHHRVGVGWICRGCGHADPTVWTEDCSGDGATRRCRGRGANQVDVRVIEIKDEPFSSNSHGGRGSCRDRHRGRIDSRRDHHRSGIDSRHRGGIGSRRDHHRSGIDSRHRSRIGRRRDHHRAGIGSRHRSRIGRRRDHHRAGIGSRHRSRIGRRRDHHRAGIGSRHRSRIGRRRDHHRAGIGSRHRSRIGRRRDHHRAGIGSRHRSRIGRRRDHHRAGIGSRHRSRIGRRRDHHRAGIGSRRGHAKSQGDGQKRLCLQSLQGRTKPPTGPDGRSFEPLQTERHSKFSCSCLFLPFHSIPSTSQPYIVKMRGFGLQ